MGDEPEGPGYDFVAWLVMMVISIVLACLLASNAEKILTWMG